MIEEPGLHAEDKAAVANEAGLAFVILAHREFDSLFHSLRAIYHAENIYCVCVNTKEFTAAIKELNRFRHLSNVHVIPVPPTSWGEATEAYLTGIDFCLQIGDQWTSLVMMSGVDLPLIGAKKLRALVATQFRDKIICYASVHPPEFEADREAQNRLLVDPFKQGVAAGDMIVYNPFSYPIPTGFREGLTYSNAPDSSRTGWTNKSHFITLLSRQSNQTNATVVTQNISKFSRRLLRKYFENRDFAMGSFWGQVFPRDFCCYLATDEEALAGLDLISKCFSGEEKFFCTMAFSSRFRDRIVVNHLIHTLPTVDARISLADLDREKTIGKIFARKIPDCADKAEFVDAVYQRYAIETSPQVEGLRNKTSYCSIEELLTLFKTLVSLDGARFRFGSLGGTRFADVILSGDGDVVYADRVDEHGIGNRWSWGDAEICTTAPGVEGIYSRFDGFRYVD